MTTKRLWRLAFRTGLAVVVLAGAAELALRLQQKLGPFYDPQVAPDKMDWYFNVVNDDRGIRVPYSMAGDGRCPETPTLLCDIHFSFEGQAAYAEAVAQFLGPEIERRLRKATP